MGMSTSIVWTTLHGMTHSSLCTSGSGVIDDRRIQYRIYVYVAVQSLFDAGCSPSFLYRRRIFLEQNTPHNNGEKGGVFVLMLVSIDWRMCEDDWCFVCVVKDRWETRDVYSTISTIVTPNPFHERDSTHSWLGKVSTMNSSSFYPGVF